MDRKLVNVPKVLSELVEKSDKLIRDAARPPPQEKEWFKMILDLAHKIADGEFTSGKSSSANGSSLDLVEFSPSMVPSCLQLVKGDAEKQSTRVSAFFPLKERDHLHSKKSANASGRKRNSENGSRPSVHVNGKKMHLSKFENESSSNVSAENSCKTPPPERASTRGKKNSAKAGNSLDSNANSENSLLTPKTRGKENTFRAQTNSNVSVVAERIQPATPKDSAFDRTFVKPDSEGKFVTPVRSSKVTPLNLKSKRRSSRNLSKVATLEQEMFQKKLGGLSSHSNKPNLLIRSSRFSIGKKKYSGLKEAHQPSALGGRCSSKASVAGKKETLQCKENIAAENLKKLQDARNKKIEEKKRLRDEKMERTKEKRMKLEKAKTLSVKQKAVEPSTRSTRAQDRSAERITRSKEPRVESTSEAIVKKSRTNPKEKNASKKSTPPLKTPSKRTQASSKQKAAGSEREKSTPEKRVSPEAVIPLKSPPPNGTPTSLRGRRPTPPMKTQPLKVTPNPTVISLQNTTVVVNKETESNSTLKRTQTPTSPRAAKAISKSREEESVSSSGEKRTESTSASSSKKPKLEAAPAATPKTQTAAKKPDSYELTPDRSSFTSYDMSEIVSDDDDDEEKSGVQKPVPSWALGLRLRNALIHQYYNPVDTDELFGNVYGVPDLEQMFNVKKNTYSKRTSSANWQSPRAFR